MATHPSRGEQIGWSSRLEPEEPHGRPADEGEPVPRRRWWVAAVAVLAILALAGGAAAYHNYRTALDWQDRAVAAERELERSREELDETEVRLRTSERDAERLEGRVSALASEKARVEDQREAAIIAAGTYAQLAGLARPVADDLCIDAWRDFTRALLDVDRLDASSSLMEADRADRGCVQASTDNGELTRLIDSLR